MQYIVFLLFSDQELPETPARRNETKFVVFQSCLRLLMLRCVKCAEVCRVFTKKTFGSLVGLEQVCPRGQSWKWESQPRDGMLPLGNLQLAGSLFLSGSSPVRGLRMLSFLNLQNISFFFDAEIVPHSIG